VKIVKNLPPEQGTDIRRTIHLKKLFTFNYLVKHLNTNEVIIYFKRHFIDKVYMNAIGVFLQAQILEPIMYLKLLEQNVIFMHAGGVCDEKNGYMFPAYGGTGKTTFSIALLNHAYKLLGDDLLFVDTNNKMVYPYPRPLHLFTYNINNLHGANVPLRYKLAIYTKNILRFFLEKILRTEFLISTRVHADEIFNHNPFGQTVPYVGIFFLVKEGPSTAVKIINQSNSLQLAREIMESEDLNDSLYELIADKMAVEQIIKLEEKVIQRLVEQFKELTYVNTRELNLLDLGSFINKNFKQEKL
jgi:hypothetical protein